MKNERKEELKDEMKNRISLALKDPILQQGFEIICKENAELERKLEQTEKDLADYQFNYPTIKELEKENERLKGDLELWESGACRAINLDKCDVVKELNAQLTIAKELLKWWVSYCGNHDLHYAKKTEQFLKNNA